MSQLCLGPRVSHGPVRVCQSGLTDTTRRQIGSQSVGTSGYSCGHMPAATLSLCQHMAPPRHASHVQRAR